MPRNVSIGMATEIPEPEVKNTVKRWRYRLFLPNGEPVRVEATITVNFQLSH